MDEFRHRNRFDQANHAPLISLRRVPLSLLYFVSTVVILRCGGVNSDHGIAPAFPAPNYPQPCSAHPIFPPMALPDYWWHFPSLSLWSLSPISNSSRIE
ncbi:uncharacterized protein BDV14DRAFT_52180 [Aspergillus stella-maris]|uniref:uncharacterized protein n=1 Tax=Aspergillus stella-maris TaxID=1810926 RepID=UPI003CCDDC92